jgi:hypothetical protein
MGHFDEAEEKEKEKREKLFDYQQQAKAGMLQGDKTVLGDLKEEQQKMKEQKEEIFTNIDEMRRHILVGYAYKTNEKLSEWGNKKILNGDELMREILDISWQTYDVLRRAECSYVIKVMVNKGFVNHIKQMNLPLCSEQQKYEINRQTETPLK